MVRADDEVALAADIMVLAQNQRVRRSDLRGPRVTQDEVAAFGLSGSLLDDHIDALNGQLSRRFVQWICHLFDRDEARIDVPDRCIERVQTHTMGLLGRVHRVQPQVERYVRGFEVFAHRHQPSTQVIFELRDAVLDGAQVTWRRVRVACELGFDDIQSVRDRLEALIELISVNHRALERFDPLDRLDRIRATDLGEHGITCSGDQLVACHPSERDRVDRAGHVSD